MFDALELADALAAESDALIADALNQFETGMRERTRPEAGARLDVGRDFYGIDLSFHEAPLARRAA